MKVLETERLVLRHFGPEDAAFILRLLNEPSFIQHIGDKGVRSLEDARQYLLGGPIDSYERYGYGLNRVELKVSGEPIGMCGLVRRDTLEDADIGYALLEQHWSKGYAAESAGAVLNHARDVLGLRRVVAIVAPGNQSSIRLLENIGLTFERMIRLSDDAEELKFFAAALQ